MPEATVEVGDLVTLTNVPVLETGIEYPASTGPFTPSAELLQSIIDSQDDPHIPPPRIKLGHVENPIDDDLQTLFQQAREEAGESDSEPAIGTLQNLHLSEDGQTLLADWTGLPAWLAAVLESAYPARSIEGGPWGYTFDTANGKQYVYALQAVSLLGVAWPGCTSLEDLNVLFSKEGPEGIEIVQMSAGDTGRAATEGVRMTTLAQANVGDIRRAFYDDFAQGDRYWWWDRELLINPNEFIVEDPDEDQLYRLPFNLISNGEDEPDSVEFGEPEPIKIKYIPDPPKEGEETKATVLLSAQVPKTGAVLAVNSNPPRARERENQKQGAKMSVRSQLGLPDDATDEQVETALSQRLSGESETAPSPPDAPEAPSEGNQETAEPTQPGENPDEPDDDDDTEDETTDEAGTVPVDAATLRSLQARAARGDEARRIQEETHRDGVINAAVKEGKFPPARRAHYLSLWEKDPKGTEHLLTAKVEDGGLAPGLVPVSEVGLEPEDGDIAEAATYPETMFPDAAARRKAIEAGAGVGVVEREKIGGTI